MTKRAYPQKEDFFLVFQYTNSTHFPMEI